VIPVLRSFSLISRRTVGAYAPCPLLCIAQSMIICARYDNLCKQRVTVADIRQLYSIMDSMRMALWSRRAQAYAHWKRKTV
jgi:hypothetical protein